MVLKYLVWFSIKGERAVHEEAIAYFKQMLGHSQGVFNSEVHVRRKLTVDQKEAVIWPVTHEEVRAAVFAIDSMKAPEPDGYNAAFSKSNWDIVGSEITEAVLSFFSTNKMLKAYYYILDS